MSRIPLSHGVSADGTAWPEQSWTVVAGALAALTLFRLLAAAYAPLVPDETYYWLWSRGPSAGYYDHPAMIAWWIWASTKLFGDTALGVRFLPVLAALVSSIAVVGTARELFGHRALTSRAALWFNATLLVGVGAIFASPDAPSVMFWALSTWALAALKRTGNPKFWLLVGLLAGLGCLSKYTNLFFGPGVVLWLVADRRARHWLSSPWLWAGGVTALVVFLPDILWNADHHWFTYAKQFGRIDEGGASHSRVLEFVAGQFGLLNPVIAIFAGIGVVRAFRSREESDGALFLVVLAAPLFIYMCLHSLHDRVQGNWPAPLYASAAILASFGAVGSERFLPMRRLAASAVPIGIGLSTVALAVAVVAGAAPVPFRTPADRLDGWKGLATAVRQAKAQAGARWVATFSYGLNGELAWHLGEPTQVEDIGNRRRYGFLKPDPGMAAQPALLVLTSQEAVKARFRRCFASADVLSTVERRAGSRVIETYQLIKASGAKPDILTAGCP